MRSPRSLRWDIPETVGQRRFVRRYPGSFNRARRPGIPAANHAPRQIDPDQITHTQGVPERTSRQPPDASGRRQPACTSNLPQSMEVFPVSRHLFSARRQPAAFIRAPDSVPVPRTDAPFPWTQLSTRRLVTLVDSFDKGVKETSRSPGTRGVSRDLAIAGLTPREMELQIGQLIRTSLNGRSTTMATEIVRYIEALCAHPDDRRSPEERCVLRRLAGHWRRLAWIAVESATRPSTGKRLNPSVNPLSCCGEQ